MQQAAALTSDGSGRLARDFRTLPRTQQRRLLIELIEQGRRDEEIGSLLGMSQWQVRNLRYRLGIKKDRGGNLHLEPAEEPDGALRLPPAEATAAAAADTAGGFSLTLSGTYRADQLARRLDALRALFEAAGDRRYHVRIQVAELAAERVEAAEAAPA